MYEHGLHNRKTVMKRKGLKINIRKTKVKETKAPTKVMDIAFITFAC